MKELGGASLLSIYDHSVGKTVLSLFPDYPLLPWKFSNLPKNYWNDLKNQRQFFDWLAVQLGIKHYTDWYTVMMADLSAKGALPILTRYHSNSIAKALVQLYPEHEWQLFKFKQTPQNLWNDKGRRKQYFDWIATQLNIKTFEDWYNVTTGDIHAKGGAVLLHHFYGGSLFKALEELYPHYKWKSWRLTAKQPQYWEDMHNQRDFFDWLGGELGVGVMQDWYKVKTLDVYEKGGAMVLRLYGDSLFKALKAIYPEFNWEPWKFTTVSKGFWEDMKNQRDYFEWLKKDLNIRSLADWKYIKEHHIMERGGASLLDYYGNSLVTALETIYPAYPNVLVRPVSSPTRRNTQKSDNITDHRAYFESLATKLNITTLEQWYGVKLSDLKGKGIGKILPHYGNSFVKALTTVYPTLDPWKFTSVPRGYWRSAENVQSYLNYLFGADRSHTYGQKLAGRKLRSIIIASGGTSTFNMKYLIPCIQERIRIMTHQTSNLQV